MDYYQLIVYKERNISNLCTHFVGCTLFLHRARRVVVMPICGYWQHWWLSKVQPPVPPVEGKVSVMKTLGYQWLQSRYINATSDILDTSFWMATICDRTNPVIKAPWIFAADRVRCLLFRTYIPHLHWPASTNCPNICQYILGIMSAYWAAYISIHFYEQHFEAGLINKNNCVPYPEPVYTGWSRVHWNATGMPLVDPVYTGIPLGDPANTCRVHWNTTGKT